MSKKFTFYERCFPLFWKKKKVTVYGSCSVWHYFPSGKRCSTLIEAHICDLMQAEKFADMEAQENE